MSKNELIAKIEALNAWEALMEDAKAEADAIRDSIKQEMLAFRVLQYLKRHARRRGKCPTTENTTSASAFCSLKSIYKPTQEKTAL